MSSEASTSVITERTVKPKRRFLWFGCLVAVCIAVWITHAIHHAMQPKYQGKTAAEWFEEIKYARWIHGEFISTNDPPFLALIAMETNSFPTLKDKFNEKDSSIVKPMKIWLNQTLGCEFSISDRDERYGKIRFLLRALGNKADALVPFFLSKVQNTDGAESTAASLSLLAIGTHPEAVIPAMVQKFEGEPESSNEALAARLCIGQYSNHIELAVSHLTNALNSTDSNQRFHAAATLADLGQTNAVLSYLANEMNNPRSLYRLRAKDSLREGTNTSFLHIQYIYFRDWPLH